MKQENLNLAAKDMYEALIFILDTGIISSRGKRYAQQAIDKANGENDKTINNGEPIQTFIHYGNVILERIGGNFYLRGLGKDFQLPELKVKNIIDKLNNMDINQPLTAAEWLAQNIENGQFDNYNIN